jgi:multidrug efflux pump subunit AcrB
METLSRVKKNQTLRNTIENDREEELVSPALSSYAERLNKINPMLTRSSSPSSNSSYQALHSRREQSLNLDKTEPNSMKNSIESDYINEFLEEVRNYNLKKGYRTEFDTDLEILNQHEIKEIKEEVQFNEVPVQNEDLTQEIKKIIENDYKDLEVSPVKESDDINQVLEETQKLRVQLNDYEKELIDMNESVMSSHRVLNIVVFILVLVLVVMLGFAIYWVLYSKGYY